MKYLVIFLLATLFSCHSTEDDTLLFLNEGVEKCNEILKNSTDTYYSMMWAASKENPRLVNPIKKKPDSVYFLTDLVINLIESSKNKTVSEEKAAKSQKFLLKTKDVSGTRLTEFAKKYSMYIIQQNKIDSFYYGRVHLPTNEKTNFSILELNLLVNKIRLINYNALTFYAKKIEGKTYQFSKNLPVVIPKKRYLKYGEEYKAKIFLTVIDTTMDMRLILPNDTLFSENGIFHYKEIVKKPGKYIRGGVIETDNPKTLEIMKFPCEIEYMVTK
jgi:hypothetical protein